MPNGHVMPLTVSAAPAATHVPTSRPPPTKVATAGNATSTTQAAQPATAAAVTSRGQQQAALNRLLAKYTYDMSRGANASTLSSLGQQIGVAAKALGQHVTLPHAPNNPGAGSATKAKQGTINVTA
jgi:hypothetical protein